jgi:Zn-dependent protease with chaperone function
MALLYSALAFFLGFCVSALGLGSLVALALRPWRHLPAEPWTERARQLHPIRTGLASWTFAVPLAAFVGGKLLWPELPSVSLVLGAMLGSVGGAWPLDRALYPNLTTRQWLQGAAVLSLFNLVWFILVFAAIALLPPDLRIGPTLAVTAGFLAAGIFVAHGSLFHFVATCGWCRPASPRLAALVAEAAKTAQVEVRQVWELPSPAGYAAALFGRRALVFSTTTVEEHEDAELSAICRHELAHLQEGRGLLALRLVQMPLSLLPFVYLPLAVSHWGVLGLSACLVVWILITRGFARLSLALEKRADHTALHDSKAEDYARALERLHRRNLVPAVLAPKTIRTHPDLYDRMVSAGIIPDYPRPAAPAESHWLQHLSTVLTISCVVGLALWLER